MTEYVPPAPENVRAILRDGTEIAIECRYNGRAEDGTDRWVMVDPPSLSAPPVTIAAEVWPDDCEIFGTVENILADIPCSQCGAMKLRIEMRLESRPIGTFSLAGQTPKAPAVEWPWAVCDGCGGESRGREVFGE